MRPRGATAWRRRSQGLGPGVFGRGHGLEIGALQAFAFGEAEGDLGLDFVLWLAGRRGGRRRCERFGHALGARRSGVVAPTADVGQHRMHPLFEQLGVAPEGVEGGVEDELLLVPVQHHGRQRGVHIGAAIQAHGLDRGDRRQHTIGPDLQARGAQDAREVDDVLGQQHVSSHNTAEAEPSVRRSISRSTA
jgi:hypothetical protein